MDNSQTFMFRVLTGERYLEESFFGGRTWILPTGKLIPPVIHYVTINNADADFRISMAYKATEYIFKDTKGHSNPHITRIDHLTEDALVKLLDYDYKKFRCD